MAKRPQAILRSLFHVTIFGLGVITFISACGSQDSRYIDLDDPTEISLVIAVPTFTLTPTSSGPKATLVQYDGFDIDLSAEREVWVYISVDGEKFLDHHLSSGGRVQFTVKELLEIQTDDIESLQIIINGEVQELSSEWGRAFFWDGSGHLIIPQLPTATPTVVSTPVVLTPAPPLYQLAEGNASEPITRNNVVRLMDLARMDTNVGPASRLAYSPDSRWLVFKKAGETNGQTHIHLLELDTGVSRQLTHPEVSRSWLWNCDYAFHPNGDFLIASTGGRFWRINVGNDSPRLFNLPDYSSNESIATGLALSPDGDLVLSTTQYGVVSLLETETWTELFSYQVQPDTPPIAGWEEWRQASDPIFSQDGQYFAFIGRGIHLWKTQNQSLQFQSEGAYYQDTKHLAVFGNTLAASAPGNIYFLEFSNNVVSQILPAPKKVSGIDYSADGSLLAVGTHNGGLFIYDPRTNELVTSRQAYEDGIWRIEFSPDGRWLATIDYEGELILWAIPW